MIIDLPTDRVSPNEEALRDSDLIRRYARNELQGDALEAFELELFNDPSLVQQVEAELAWYQGGHAPSEPAKVTALPVAGDRRRQRGWGQPRWAMAATLVVGLGLGSGLMLLRPVEPSLQQATMVSLSAVRGGDSDNSFSVAAGQPVVLRYLARSPAAHTMEILDASGKRVDWQSDLRPDEQGWLVMVGPTLNSAGAPYQVQVRAGDVLETFKLVVDAS
ncbi:MAG: hypothetical protein R3F15_05000 [Lysobacterales bacterium]